MPPAEGIAPADVQAALFQFETDLANGVAVLAPCNFQEVSTRGRSLETNTRPGMASDFGVLHVATALHLGAKEFLKRSM